jgi:hypothetical protein
VFADFSFCRFRSTLICAPDFICLAWLSAAPSDLFCKAGFCFPTLFVCSPILYLVLKLFHPHINFCSRLVRKGSVLRLHRASLLFLLRFSRPSGARAQSSFILFVRFFGLLSPSRYECLLHQQVPVQSRSGFPCVGGLCKDFLFTVSAHQQQCPSAACSCSFSCHQRLVWFFPA